MTEVRASKKISENVQSAKNQTSKEIENLRFKQKQAIQNLNYGEAEEIQRQIDNLNSQTCNYALDTIIDQFNENLNSVLTYIFNEENVQKEKQKILESKLKGKFARQFEITKRKQLLQIKQLEDQLISNRELELTRAVPAQATLVAASQRAATSGDFATAQKLLNESRQVGEEEKARRLKELEDNFDKQRSDLLSLFGIEFQQLTQKMHYEQNRLKEQGDEKQRVFDQNKSTQLSGLCQKYMKLATSYGGGSDGDALSYEIQQIYLAKCKEYNIKPTQFQIEQNLSSRQKAPKSKARNSTSRNNSTKSSSQLH